jgi:hypothetical protein
VTVSVSWLGLQEVPPATSFPCSESCRQFREQRGSTPRIHLSGDHCQRLNRSCASSTQNETDFTVGQSLGIGTNKASAYRTMSPREQQPASLQSDVIGERDLQGRVPSESSLTSLDRATETKLKGVAFGSVSVRVYERIVGDHPGRFSWTSAMR